MTNTGLTAVDKRASEYLVRLTKLDRLIHQRYRLGLLVVLFGEQPNSLSYAALQRITGLTMGNMSNHLTKLEEAGLVQVHRRFVDKKPRTSACMTDLGVSRLEAHFRELFEVRDGLEAMCERRAG